MRTIQILILSNLKAYETDCKAFFLYKYSSNKMLLKRIKTNKIISLKTMIIYQKPLAELFHQNRLSFIKNPSESYFIKTDNHLSRNTHRAIALKHIIICQELQITIVKTYNPFSRTTHRAIASIQIIIYQEQLTQLMHQNS